MFVVALNPEKFKRSSLPKSVEGSTDIKVDAPLPYIRNGRVQTDIHWTKNWTPNAEA